MRVILTLMILSSGFLYSQKKNPDKILEEVKRTFNQVKDYVVDVNIKIDVDFLKAPETNATIYFKQPGKIHLESEGFAMLPKGGMDFSPLGLLKDEYTAIYDRVDTIDGFITDVVKVIPIGDKNDIILTTLWIDESEYFIRRVESTRKIGGTFSLELKYSRSKTDYPLPSSMVFTFNIDRSNLPRGMADKLTKKKPGGTKETKTGKVFITYKNYKVNEGIPDSVFEEKGD